VVDLSSAKLRVLFSNAAALRAGCDGLSDTGCLQEIQAGGSLFIFSAEAGGTCR